jgi:hypothetical protein
MGIGVAKPDRHLQRLARASGFASVGEFCGTIASFLREKTSALSIPFSGGSLPCTNYVARFAQSGGRNPIRRPGRQPEYLMVEQVTMTLVYLHTIAYYCT